MCRLHTNPEPQFEAPQHNHGSKQSADLKTWLAQHGEFRPLAEQFHRLHHRQYRDQLACGALAARSLRRYSRELNPTKFAMLLTTVTGETYSRETINNYRDAFRMYHLWKQKCGNRPPHLEISKLAKAWGAGKGTFGDDEKVKLCQRTAEKGLSKSKMKDEILRLSTEKTRTRLTYDIVPCVEQVRHMDGLDLLRQCQAESVDLVVLDWMYKPYLGSDAALPQVHLPDDPVGHLIECLRAARPALSPHGAVALFVDHQSDHDLKIITAARDCGLGRVDQYVWQKPAGTFSGRKGALFANSHDVIDIYRRVDVESFPPHVRYAHSVSPRWHCRSHRASSEREVHPFEKPVELMKELIGSITVNGLVVDPFAGSGSSGVAAVELGCGYRGAEMIEEYVEIANRRIAVGADREAETVEAINAGLIGANAEQQAAITVYLEQAGIRLKQTQQLKEKVA
jgi:DNA modification methylase